ncbi:putative holin-like toxin [Vagococcus hydrophili]|uniref:Putative holin-like toxin n=1 Tax=Vagococcus hydrophili TaxID=2714947 RepID=A0A6G8AR50_9ENTE|nr:putative holin-like toxin [Vagococcus hydrophili]
MNITTQSRKGEPILSISEALQLMIAFGSFTLTLVSTIVLILKNDKKK